MAYDPLSVLKRFSQSQDAEIDLAAVAIAFAVLDLPDISVQRFQVHVDKVIADVAGRHAQYVDAGGADDAGTRLASLRDVFVMDHGYRGDSEEPDHLDNYNILRVIERRSGSSLMLSLMYMHVALALEWPVVGLDIPGRFLVRIEGSHGGRIMFDPFNEAAPMQAHDVRALIKEARGEDAELSASYFDGISRRDMLLGVQNKIKFQLIAGEDYEGALKIVQAMQVFAPRDYRLLLDAGVLYARLSQAEPAIFALEQYIARAPNDRDRREAALLLDDIRRLQ